MKNKLEERIDRDIDLILTDDESVIAENRKKIIILLCANPLMGQAEIAKRLHLNLSTVRETMDTVFFKSLTKEIDEIFKQRLSRITLKSLDVAEKMLVDNSISKRERWNISKFFLDKGIDRLVNQQDDEKIPDEIIFETRINASGNLEKDTKKVFYNSLA